MVDIPDLLPSSGCDQGRVVCMMYSKVVVEVGRKSTVLMALMSLDWVMSELVTMMRRLLVLVPDLCRFY